VAYADFVTAMMALFLVLWLASQDEKIKEAVQRSFTNPFSSLTKESVGIIPTRIPRPGRKTNRATSIPPPPSNWPCCDTSTKTAQGAANGRRTGEATDRQVGAHPEGLRISIFDRSRRPIFKAQSAEFTPYGDWVMSTLAWQISRYASFAVELEGHTESGHPPVRADYGDWEISSDRASAARRKLLEHGVAAGQIRRVAGYGDTVPMPEAKPEDESNRRITVMLKLRSAKNSSA